MGILIRFSKSVAQDRSNIKCLTSLQMPNLVYFKGTRVGTTGVVRGPLTEEMALAYYKSNCFRPDHVFRVIDSDYVDTFVSIDDLCDENGEANPFGVSFVNKEEELARMLKELNNNEEELTGVHQELYNTRNKLDSSLLGMKKLHIEACSVEKMIRNTANELVRVRELRKQKDELDSKVNDLARVQKELCKTRNDLDASRLEFNNLRSERIKTVAIHFTEERKLVEKLQIKENELSNKENELTGVHEELYTTRNELDASILELKKLRIDNATKEKQISELKKLRIYNAAFTKQSAIKEKQELDKSLSDRAALESRVKQLEGELKKSRMKANQNTKSKKTQMSFDDLTDTAIMQVMDKLDLRSRLRMRRVSRRMNELQLQVKNKLEMIQFMTSRYGGEELAVKQFQTQYPLLILCSDLDALANGIPRLVMNTHIQKIELELMNGLSKRSNRLFNELFKFNADELVIRPYENRPWLSVLELTFSTLLTIAQNIRKVSIEELTTSLTVPDYCHIRKWIGGHRKLESFSVRILPKDLIKFMEICFRITVDRNSIKYDWRTAFYSKTSIKLYMKEKGSTLDLCHFKGGLQTTILGNLVTFEKSKGVKNLGVNYKKVVMNHRPEFAPVYSEDPNDDEHDCYEDYVNHRLYPYYTYHRDK